MFQKTRDRVRHSGNLPGRDRPAEYERRPYQGGKQVTQDLTRSPISRTLLASKASRVLHFRAIPSILQLSNRGLKAVSTSSKSNYRLTFNYHVGEKNPAASSN
jgi:hypothetical protein